MKKIVLPLTFFSLVIYVFVTCCTPDLTWVNVDCDGIYYYNKAVHLIDWGTQPVFSLLSHAMIQIPVGTMTWRAAFMMSVVPAIITTVLIFFAVRKQTTNEYAPYIGAAAFAASPIVISQATIHEIYSMTAMFCTLAYLLYVYKKHSLSMVALGLAAGTYILAIPAVLIAFALWTPNKLRLLILVPFIAVTLLVGRYYSIYDTQEYWAFLPGVLLHGEISGVPLRMLQTLGILVVAMGVAWLPALLYLKDWKKSLPIILILVIPMIHLLTCPCIEGYVQLYSASPFIAIAAGLGVEKLKTKSIAQVIFVFSCVTIAIAPQFWDIGVTVDRTPTTARTLLHQISEVPDDSVILCSRQLNGVEDSVGMLNRGAVEMLNRENDMNLIYVNPSMYASETDKYNERTRLRDLGFVTPYIPMDWDNWDCWDHQNENMLAFARANGNIEVYLTVITEPEVFGCELVKLN